MSSGFPLDVGFANVRCPDDIKYYPDFAETSRSVCSILHSFVLVVLCAVVLAAYWLNLPLCSPFLTSSMTVDSDVVCEVALPSLAVVWKILEERR